MTEGSADRRHAPDAPHASSAAGPLGFDPMDRIHAEFEALLARAGAHGQAAPACEQWPTLLAQIDEHLRNHFETEDRWMLQTQFPAAECHQDEHAAVLRSSAEVLAMAREGNFRAAPSFIAALADWFPGHAAYLDSALAAWMCKRQLGGPPVVMHRRAVAASNLPEKAPKLASSSD